MVAILAAGAIYVLARLAGTLQKHVFEPLVIREVRETFKEARPHATGSNALLMDAVIASWDVAVGWAYDDPVELLADLGALGVKTSLVKAGVSLLPRVGLALSTKGAVQAVEVFLGAITDLVRGDVQVSVSQLEVWAQKLTPDFVTEELIKDGTKVALDIGALAAETGEFVSKAQSGDVFGSLKSGLDLIQKGFNVVGSFLAFVKRAEEVLPEPPPRGRTITDAELKRFQESLRVKPRSLPKRFDPTSTAVIPTLLPGEDDIISGRFIHENPDLFANPDDLRTSLLRWGGRIPAAASLGPLKGRETAPTFPFG